MRGEALRLSPPSDQPRAPGMTVVAIQVDETSFAMEVDPANVPVLIARWEAEYEAARTTADPADFAKAAVAWVAATNRHGAGCGCMAAAAVLWMGAGDSEILDAIVSGDTTLGFDI